MTAMRRKRQRRPHLKTPTELHRSNIHPRWLRPLAVPGECSWHGGYTAAGEPCGRKVNGRRCRDHTNRRALRHPVAIAS